MFTVLGGTGFLGAHVAGALALGGQRVRVVGRRPRVTRARALERVLADLDRPETLAPALAGARVVVHAAAPYPRVSLDPARVVDEGLAQTRALLDLVASAGAQRLVFVSSTATVGPAPPERPADERDRWPARPGIGAYHDLKWALEDLVCREGRFEVVVVCPSGCLGPGDFRLGTCAWLVAIARGLPVPHPDGWVSWVDVRDVGFAVAALATGASPIPRTVLSAGSRRLHALLEELAARYGAPAPPAPLSTASARALADGAERAVAGGGRPALSRELVDLVTTGFPLCGDAAARALGFTYTPLTATLDAFDAWARSVGLLPRTPEVHP